MALRPNPKEDRQHYDACELQALSECPQYHSSEHDRKYPGQDGRQHDDPRAEGQTVNRRGVPTPIGELSY